MNYSSLTKCGCFWVIHDPTQPPWQSAVPKPLPLVDVAAHTTIFASTSRTRLTQRFVNDTKDAIKEARYVFPLYDGVSVVKFQFTVAGRTVHGVVKERGQAKKTYQDAVDRGETAGLLEMSLAAADVFTTAIGNVPAGEHVRVEIEYIGELKHDAEVDGLRFTIPAAVVPRYGDAGSLQPASVTHGKLEVTVDVDMPEGNAIKSIQSPSHPLTVSIGTTSTTPDADPSLRKASATLSLGSATLDKDFIVQVVAFNIGEPSAVVETHPTLDSKALMVTLVPKFDLPPERPEIVFVCDRSGSMSGTIPDLVAALNIFLKSLPVGVKFNICSFGSTHSFLWERSKSYSQESLDEAVAHVKSFAANYGGTEMYGAMEDTFKRRYKDMNLEVFLLTDGEIWGQDQLFELINKNVGESKGAIRVFSIGIGLGASTSLVEGVARAGRGFAQTVDNGEKMDKKVIRMLKGALFPHITDYSLEIKYDTPDMATDDDDDFELIEKVNDALTITGLEDIKDAKASSPPTAKVKAPISLFNRLKQVKDDVKTAAPAKDAIPSVDRPRYICIPGEIPALFPFNRTTAYVLISGPTARPKSVLLKGTCDHGPLELEIPITAGEAGVTIHQLAARKEMKELEEGRGWTSFAKDAKGELLKKKYDGRYSDIVEREAVDLGTTFQIVGKWTSFVAVQDGSDKVVHDEVAPAYEVSYLNGGKTATSLWTPFTPLYNTDGVQYATAPSPPVMRSAMYGGGGPRPRVLYRDSRAPMAFGGMRGGDAMPTAAPIAAFSAAPLSQQATLPPPPVCPAPAPSLAACAPPPPPNYAQENLKMPQQQQYHQQPYHQSAPSKKMSIDAVVDTADPVQALASLQTFSGSWSWNPTLEAVLNVQSARADSLTTRVVDSAQNKSDLVATACAIAFLHKKAASDKERWEMFVDKAVAWLEHQGVDATELVTAVEVLF